MTDYTKEAEELYPMVPMSATTTYMVRQYQQMAHIAARQQSAAEIDRLRGEVRKLREGLEDCDTLLAHLEDYAHGDGGKMITQQRGKIQQLLTETK